MRKRGSGRFLFIAALAASLLLRLTSGGEGREAVVTAVYDGDTIKLRFGGGRSEVVRLIGVDAPELDDTRESVRFLALMSKRYCFLALYGKEVTLEYDREARDRHGRLLAYVFTGGDLFNDAVIRSGFASVLLRYPFREDYRYRFTEAEKEARALGRGLWCPEPYPHIDAGEAAEFRGRLMRVGFVCRAVEARGRFVFLRADAADFAALVERGERASFPDDRLLLGKRLTVTGLVEEYRGHAQLLLFLPSQLAF